jgi:serine/threonine protein phosphatase PrpC
MTNSDVILDQIVIAKAQHVGFGNHRQSHSDRSVCKIIETASGMTMLLGMIASDIDCISNGLSANQLIIDTIINNIANSQERNISSVLNNAIQLAHQAVNSGIHKTEMHRLIGSSVTIAAIEDGKLYLAHVGNCRAVLMRSGDFTQLTLDHTWENERAAGGNLSSGKVEQNGSKPEPARYVGQSDVKSLNVDLGLRLDNETDPAKSKLIDGGLNLVPGDRIILCNGGLVKTRPAGKGQSAENNEILKRVPLYEAQEAADMLVDLAISQHVEDSVSVVIFEIPRANLPEKALLTSNRRSLLITAGIATILGLAILLVSISAFSLFLGTDRKSLILSTAPVIIANTSSPFKSTDSQLDQKPPVDFEAPSVSVLPNLITPAVVGKAIVADGILEYQIIGQDANTTGANEEVPFGPDVRMWSDEEPVQINLDNGSIVMLDPLTAIYLATDDEETNHTIKVMLERGSILTAQGKFSVMSTDERFRILVDEGMVGVNFEPLLDAIAVNCFGPDGDCLIYGFDALNELKPGQQLKYKEGIRGEIENTDLIGWREHFGDVLPTPTATPTPTITSTPTKTPTPIPPTATPTLSNQGDQGLNNERNSRKSGGDGGGDGGSGG